MSFFRKSMPELMREARQVLESVPRPLSAGQIESRGISLRDFVKACWHIIEPDTRLAWSWALDAMCDHVEALLTGKLGKTNLIITVPPGAMKSTIVSVATPSWMWINRPQWRAIHASGNFQVSVRDSLRCRAILDSSWYRNRFGISWQFASDQNLKSYYANSASGFRSAVSSGSKITGSRADSLFVDDALDASDSYSENARGTVIEWWRSAFANRLNDMQTGTRCVIQQRLHPEDLVGWILANEPGEWESLSIPQEWEESRRFTSSLGWTDPRTEEGALMFPQRFPASVVAAERARLGESGYAGQHQQRPFNASGEVFKTGLLQWWNREAPLPVFLRVILSADTAFKSKETSDFSAICVLGEVDNKGIFILDVVKGRWALPQLLEVIQSVAKQWRPSAVLVEDAASGQSVLQVFQQTTSLPIKGITPAGEKLVRAHAIVPTWEARRCYAIEGAAFLPDFLAELHAFPKSVHDDQVDAFVQGVRYLTTWADGTGFVEYARQELEKIERSRTAAA